MTEPLKLGTERSWGETVCQYGVERPECDKPATRHFMWLKTNHTSPACDEHAAFIHSRDTTNQPFDEHTHEPNCGMPGAMWRFPYEDQDEGYCFVEAPDDLALMVEELEPALVNAPAEDEITHPTTAHLDAGRGNERTTE